MHGARGGGRGRVAPRPFFPNLGREWRNRRVYGSRAAVSGAPVLSSSERRLKVPAPSARCGSLLAPLRCGPRAEASELRPPGRNR